MPEKLFDAFAPELRYSIEEAKGEVDGKHVLAKLRGEFFFPDGISRNNRFYSKNLWNKVLAEAAVKERLQERRMFGTISHEQEINDTALLDGKLSHVVTNLGIQEGNKGIGEALILNTHAGRTLNACLRAGTKLFVSSRASGGMKGETKSGVPVVDENSYKLQTFDFVLEPGFLQASPQVAEQLQESQQLNEDFKATLGEAQWSEETKDVEWAVSPTREASPPELPEDGPPKETPPTGGRTVPPELLEQLTERSLRAEQERDDALGKLEDANSKKSEADGKLTAANETIAELKKQLEASGETKSELDALKKTLEELGAPERVKQALVEANELFEELKRLSSGTVEDAKRLIQVGRELEERFNSIEEVASTMAMARKLGEDIKDLGTLETIREALQFSLLMREQFEAHIRADRVEKLAAEIGGDKDAIKGMVEKGMSDDDIRGVFKKVSESARVSRYRKEPVKDEVNPEKRTPFTQQSRGSRLMEDFTRGTRDK